MCTRAAVARDKGKTRTVPYHQSPEKREFLRMKLRSTVLNVDVRLSETSV